LPTREETNLSTFDLVLGIVVVVVGALFGVFAQTLVNAVDFESKRLHYGRATLAVALGAVLLAASSFSNSPDLIRIFGVVTFVGGLALFTLPHTAWVRITQWWTKEHLTFYRVLTLITTSVLGGLLVISALG
jgi:hypothetical protein